MKELILFCAVAAVFVLCGFILKKMGAFFENDKNAPPKKPEKPVLSIAFEHTEEVSFLNELLEHFSQQSPSCELNLFYGSPGEIRRQIKNEKIDLGFIRKDPALEPDESFHSFHFVLDENVVACEPVGLPVIPLCHKNFFMNAIWKKNSTNPQVSLFINQLKSEY